MSIEAIRTAPGEGPRDPTFRSYSAAQAAAYAESRKGYSNTLYDYVMNHHLATGGQNDILLDVGCGPGNATRDLALYFDHAVGCDPGHEMIVQARAGLPETKSGHGVIFEVCSAEDLSKLQSVTLGSVDMITCAMSAHWFQLEQFYTSAAQMLKPGGTLAMWTCGSFFVHPNTPNAKTIQGHLDKLEQVALRPFSNRGNMLSYNLYETLDLPWTLAPQVCQATFLKEEFHHKVWNRNGQVAEGEAGGFVNGGAAATLAEARKALGTASMVTRWREANRDRVEKGEIKDCVDETFDNISKALGVGNGDEAKVKIVTGQATGLVMLKRSLLVSTT